VINLIGTRIGSTTVPVAWYGNLAASTTYPLYVGGKTDEAVFSFNAVNASSTSRVHLSVLGSFDTGCETATTSTTALNQLLKSEIRWFDASNHIKGSSAVSSFTNGTSTLQWVNPTPGQTKELILTDLDMQCVAIEANASSTTLQARYQLKEH
jgi:hypothetical protein